MKTYTFSSNVEKCGWMKPRKTREIKKEQMFWSADVNYVEPRAGFITKNFIEQLDPTKDWIIDSRVHMLMPGWYPCIGGWHLDNMPRNTPNKQPNVDNPPFICDHVLAIIDSTDDPTGSLTEFLTTDVTLPKVDDDKLLYGEWSPEINRQLKEGIIESDNVPSQNVISFNSNAFHRGIPAVNFGWRFFIRAMTNTPQKPKNEIRRQANVYIQAEAGW